MNHPHGFQGEGLGIHVSVHSHPVVWELGYGPVLTANTLEITSRHKDGVALGRSRMESPRCDNGSRHSTDAKIASQPVYPAPVFAQDALTEVVLEINIFHEAIGCQSIVIIRNQPPVRRFVS